MKCIVSQLLLRKFLIINQHLLSMLASKMKSIFSSLPKFQFLFSKLLKICEQSSVRDSSEKASLIVSVIKICSVWETSCYKYQIH